MDPDYFADVTRVLRECFRKGPACVSFLFVSKRRKTYNATGMSPLVFLICLICFNTFRNFNKSSYRRKPPMQTFFGLVTQSYSRANVCWGQGDIPLFPCVPITAADFGPREVQQTPTWPFNDYVNVKSFDLNTLSARSWRAFNTWRKLMSMVFGWLDNQPLLEKANLFAHRRPKLSLWGVITFF